MIEFRLLDDEGDEEAALPDVESFSLSPVLCDSGAIEFSYPRDGRNWELLRDRDEFAIAVYIDGERQDQLDALVKEVDGDDAEDASVWKFTGHFNNGRLGEAIVYPKGWPSVNAEDVKVAFSSATVGTVIKTLVQQAQTRGTLAGITTSSFTATLDSNGTPWDKLLTVEYAPQLDYLEILRNLYAQRLVEFEMVGLDLRLYVFESLAVDHTVGTSPLVFRRGRDLTDSPRKRSTRDLGTVMLAAGDEGLYVERVDAPGVASRRRIEKKASQGQVKDMGTLTAYADAELARISEPKMEKTHGLVFADDETPRPVRDFNVGDWAYSDMGNGLERLRIKQWVLSLSNNGDLTGSVSLNDLFAEQNEILSRRVEGIVGGSTITGASQAVDVVPPEIIDGIAPAVPTGLSLASSAYMDNQGHTFAQVSASWLQVTTNSDGTALEDLEGYRLRWKRPAETGWTMLDGGQGTFTSFSPVEPGIVVQVQIQAYDRVGNASPWSGTQSITTGADATPPEKPSDPIVDNYLGLLRIRWDGNTDSGAAVAPDQAYVEVHVSATNGFTPSAATRYDSLIAAGSSFYEAPYASPRYVKLIAVDYNGNSSVPSDQGTGDTVQVVNADLFTNAVGTAQLQDLVVTTAKINLLAVNTAQIGSLDVGKLTAGILSAAVTLSGRIATALTGQRVEINSLGIFQFNSAGTQTVAIDSTGALITGRYRTALTGRRIEMGSAGLLSDIQFWSPDGDLSFVRAFTESAGVEAMQIGVDLGQHSLWNRLNINSDEWTTLQSRIIDQFYLATNGGFFAVRERSARTGGTSGIRITSNDTYAAIRGPDLSTEHAIFENEHRFYVGGSQFEGSMVLLRHGVADSFLRSPVLGFRSENVGNNPANGFYAQHLKYVIASNGTSGRMQITGVDDSTLAPLETSNLALSSSIAGKDIIGELERGQLAKVQATRPQRYRRKPYNQRIVIDEDGRTIKHLGKPMEEPETIGLVAEYSPDEITLYDKTAIGGYEMMTMTWAAVGEAADEIDSLKNTVATLVEDVKKLKGGDKK